MTTLDLDGIFAPNIANSPRQTWHIFIMLRRRFIRTTESRVTGNTGAAAVATPNVEESCFTADSGISPVCT